MKAILVETVRLSRAASVLLALLLFYGCGSDPPTRPTGEDWIIESVASGNLVGEYCSLTSTSDGSIRLAYHDAKEQRLYYACRIGPDQWVHTRLDTVGRFGRYVHIRSDAGDTLHLVYQDTYHLDLRYARYDGSTWEYERLRTSISYGVAPRLLVRPESLHLLEMDRSRNRIIYWMGSFSNWTQVASIHVSQPPLPYFDFVMDPDGPVIALFEQRYSGNANLALKTSVVPGGSWTTTNITEVNRPLSPPVLEYDSEGNLHILFQDSDKMLVDTAGGVVDGGIGEGRICLAKGPGLSGGLWALYPLGNGLALAYCAGGGAWNRLTRIDDLYPYGQYDLHVDDQGIAHLCVYSSAAEHLYYGRWEGLR